MAFGCHKPCCCLGNERSWEEAGKLPIPEPALSRHPPQRGSLLLTPQLLQGALGGGTGGSLVPPNATAGGSVPPVHPLSLLLPMAAKENLSRKCKRRSKCCVLRVGAFNANLGGRWDVRSAHPVPGSQSHDRSRWLHRCGRGLTPGPGQWSGARLCRRAGIAGAFLTTPVYPAPGVWGSPEAMLWGCSQGPVPFAAATPRVFSIHPGPWGQRELLSFGGEAASALSRLVPRNGGRETGDSWAAVPKGGRPFSSSLRPQKPEKQPLPSWGLRTVLGPLRTQATDWPHWGREATRTLLLCWTRFELSKARACGHVAAFSGCCQPPFQQGWSERLVHPHLAANSISEHHHVSLGAVPAGLGCRRGWPELREESHVAICGRD